MNFGSFLEKCYAWYRQYSYLSVGIPALIIPALAIYYYPIYGVAFSSSSRLLDWGDIFYSTVCPFSQMPYLVGIAFAFIVIFYKNIFLIGFMFLIYLLSIFVSLVALMGMTRYGELLIYLPHVINFIICFSIIVIKVRQRKSVDEVGCE